jgi:hypothetical protein
MSRPEMSFETGGYTRETLCGIVHVAPVAVLHPTLRNLDPLFSRRVLRANHLTTLGLERNVSIPYSRHKISGKNIPSVTRGGTRAPIPPLVRLCFADGIRTQKLSGGLCICILGARLPNSPKALSKSLAAVFPTREAKRMLSLYITDSPSKHGFLHL